MKEEWKDYYIYLENLRESGIVNMFGSPAYLANEFGLDKKEAMQVVSNWMTNYEEIANKYYNNEEK